MITIDKKAHFAVSAFLALALMVFLDSDDWHAYLGVAFLVLDIGAFWEWARGWQGMESWYDLLADAAGIAAALLVWGLR